METAEILQRAEQKAAQTIGRLEQKTEAAINLRHDYRMVTHKVFCDSCGSPQVWSSIPPKWESGIWVLYMLGLPVILAIGGLLGVFVGFAVTVAYLYIPCSKFLKRRKAIRKVKKTKFVPPIYINENNIAYFLEHQQSFYNNSEK